MRIAVTSFYLFALAFVAVDMRMDAGKIGWMETFAIVLRVTLWFVPLPLAVTFLKRVRGDLFDAVSTVITATVSVILSDCVFITIISRTGAPPQYMYIPPSPLAFYTFRLALRFFEPGMLIVLAAITAARWAAARDRERGEAMRAAQLQTRLSEARLHLLRRQIHPHFLFNSLNSVAALIRHDATEGKRMLERLRRFYADAGRFQEREEVTLAEELSLVREYLGIEQVRFGSRLTVVINLEADAGNASVPTLLLQPMVENAVRHGIARVPGAGVVRVDGRVDGSRVRITIENSSVAISPSPEIGVGLANTRERLRERYGNDASFAVANAGARFVVTITLPRKLAREAA